MFFHCSDDEALQIDLNAQGDTANNSQSAKRARIAESEGSDSDNDAVASSNKPTKRARLIVNDDDSENDSDDAITKSKEPGKFELYMF